MMDKNAIKLLPAFKDYLWGGTKLKTNYNKISDFNKVAESWELSTHKDGASVVNGGAFDGWNFSEYIKKNEGCIGSRAEKFDYFPILIKFIDALDSLSVQVHPNDEYALRVEGEYGKTEMWYILEAEEGASLYYGVKKELSKLEFRERIENNTLLEVLNEVPVKKGDVFFIESGTIHAIGKGIVICEIQQNSNTTYRVYDYDRRDKDGNARELHIEKAIEVSTLTPSPTIEYKTDDANDRTLSTCKYFTVRELKAKIGMRVDISKDCFHSIIVTDGCGELELNEQTVELKKGDSVFIPAQDGSYSLKGDCDLILSYV